MNTTATAVAPASLPTHPRASAQEVALSRAIKAAWKRFILEHHATAAQHAAYALLRGQSLDKTFTPLRRPGKIQAQGGIADRARRDAEASVRALAVSAFAPFAGLLEGVPSARGRYASDAIHPLLQRVSA